MARVASTRDLGESDSPTNIVPVTSYNDFRLEVERPYGERPKHRGRNGTETAYRKYHFIDDEKAALIAEAKAVGTVVNPLRGRVGAYWGQVEALIQLGPDSWHSLKAVRTKMEEVMSGKMKKKERGGKKIETTLWADFFEKPTRSGAAKPKDGNGRIEQNFKVLQRLPRKKETGREEHNPYGIKLAQFGMCIDIEYRMVPGCDDPLPYYRLNTQWAPDDSGESIQPLYINPNGRRRRGGRAKPAETADKVMDVTTDSETTAEITTQEITVAENSPSIEEQQAVFDSEPCRVAPVEDDLVTAS